MINKKIVYDNYPEKDSEERAFLDRALQKGKKVSMTMEGEKFVVIISENDDRTGHGNPIGMPKRKDFQTFKK